MAGNSFVNPYNFIPLEKHVPDRKEVKPGNLTGVISYTLMTRTPLFIPNTSNEDAFKMGIKDHKSYDFFSYNDLSREKESLKTRYYKPVIPGSEIRGMLRNYYEIITNSCMSFVDDEEVLSKRTGHIFEAGLLERNDDGTFKLYKAEDCLLRGKGSTERGYEPIFKTEKYKEGQKVYVEVFERGYNIKPIVDKISTIDDETMEVGYIIKGEMGPEQARPNRKYQEKHNIHVLLKGEEIKVLSNNEMSTLSKVLKAYKDNGESEYNEYRDEWEIFKKGKGEDLFPVYYSDARGDFVMLSPASITREIYRNKLIDILKKQHEHQACADKNNLCPACRLFGKVGRNLKISSRVRVADLNVDNAMLHDSEGWNKYYDDIITLPTLSSPKINNMEFYIRRPNKSWFWTYDYYVDKAWKVVPYTPEINGRKFYWHHPEFKYKEEEATNINETIRPLKKNVRFKGEIYFNNITQEELNTLVYVLKAGDDEPIETKKLCYKLGGAKPLGYGSIAIQVDSVEIRSIEKDDTYKTIKYEMQPANIGLPMIEAETEANYKIMTDFERIKGFNIDYPRANEPDKNGDYPIYEWFTNNHAKFDKHREIRDGMPTKRTDMLYRQYMYALELDLKDTRSESNSNSSSHSEKKGNKKLQNNNREEGANSRNKEDALPIITTVNRVKEDGCIYFNVNNKDRYIEAKFLKGKRYSKGDTIKVLPKTINTRKGIVTIYEIVK